MCTLQNNQPCLWWSDDGKRVGTFEGHNGAVWSCDMTCEEGEAGLLHRNAGGYPWKSLLQLARKLLQLVH